MTNINGNKYITWKAIVPIGILICMTLVGVSWALSTNNANKNHSHEDSVQYRELQPIKNDISSIKKDVRDIRNYFNIKNKK